MSTATPATPAEPAMPRVESVEHACRLVLAGNPNVGKSVFFNALTGLYANVSNFPGTTVDIPQGALDEHTWLQDTPGVYGLSNFSEEESVAARAIQEADIVLNVVSALTLERDLFLTQQLIDYGKPVLVALNQMDEATAARRVVDVEKLSQLLGVPVFPTVATRSEGLDAVRRGVFQARRGNPMPDCPPPEALLEMEDHFGDRMKVYGLRRQHVNAIVSQVVRDESRPTDWRSDGSRKVGNALLNPVFGVLAGIFMLWTLYQVVGVWVAGDLVNWTENEILLGHVIPAIQNLVASVFPKGTVFYTIFAGEFGVLTMGPQYILGVLFPLVVGFYIYLSILEDCGYLPRIAVLCDGLLNRIGLNGRAVIPLILGLGCVTMATVSTRVLASNRERTIASTLLAITIPCSAQLVVLTGLMARAGGAKGWLLYGFFLVTILASLGTALHKTLPGKSTSLVLDLPPMRFPAPKNILKKTWIRTRVFLVEAAPLFLLGSLLVTLMQVTGLLKVIEAALAPVTQAVLHLPPQAAQAFIMGMVRRDFGAAGFYYLSDHMTAIQLMTSLVVITLFVPCIASATVIWKERGIRETALVLAGSWVLAFVAGALVTRLLELTHWL